jgi:hypothetical protein
MAHDAPTLAALFRVALLGAGVAWSTDDLYAQRPKDRRGREHRWSDIIVSAARQYAGASQGAPFLVGRFLGYCIREGLLTVDQVSKAPPPYTGPEDGAEPEHGVWANIAAGPVQQLSPESLGLPTGSGARWRGRVVSIGQEEMVIELDGLTDRSEEVEAV